MAGHFHQQFPRIGDPNIVLEKEDPYYEDPKIRLPLALGNSHIMQQSSEI